MKSADKVAITVLMLRVGSQGEIYQGYLSLFKMNLPALETYVGGTVDMQYLTDVLVFLYNEIDEGFENRILYSADDTPIDVICGNILCCKLINGEFLSISDEEANLFLYRLRPVKELTVTPQIVVQDTIGEGESDESLYDESF